MATKFTYGLRFTRNLGNFQNVTPYFEITEDKRETETLDQLVNRVVNKVEALMEAKVNEIDEDAK